MKTLSAFKTAFTALCLFAFAAPAPAQQTVDDPTQVLDLSWKIGSWQTWWQTRHFDSALVGEDVGYYIYLPPGYEDQPERRYPMVLWLHGAFGRPHEATPVIRRLDGAIRRGEAAPMIVVSALDPVGLSMWTDSQDGRVPMESVLLTELIPHIDARYRTIGTRAGRAIEGFSMGGYAAAYLGFKYPDMFASISILAGALHTPETLAERRPAIFDNVFGGDFDYARERSPWTWAEANSGAIAGRTHVRIFVGEEDGLLDWNRDFHALLEDRGVSHDWGVVPRSPHDVEILMRNWPGDVFAHYREAFGQDEP